ncbi:hypothetical protein AGMMS50276_31150 [Synergistales bacterium]|nr:hypothetical protein AGMMS50276_31150 [Synergistales bacterium]
MSESTSVALINFFSNNFIWLLIIAVVAVYCIRKLFRGKRSKSAGISDSQRKKCHAIIHAAATSAAGVAAGLAQIPGSDALAIVPIQIAMIISLGLVFGKKISKSAAQGILASCAATYAGRTASQWMFGWIPGIGNTLNAATAFAITEGIGWMAAHIFEQD